MPQNDGTLTFDTSLDSSGLQKGVSKAAGVARQALGVFGGQLMTKAVEGIAQIGKAALDSVGALEQNVGGIETLFGDAADAVISNAERAYLTAGMSANTYMSNVASLSAALKQSLGGDVAAAAKAADTAMRDISDNANKFGTDLDSLTQAYMGFSKGQYQLLDNLKLGFGGTKTEMERLLAYAEELQAKSGIAASYSIDNLADIYAAIHVVQEEMGITGATEAEAMTTLEGSINAAKAAWDNFTAGVGSAEQMASAISSAAGQVVAKLGDIIPRLVETLPQLVETLVPQIPGIVGPLIPAAIDAALGILDAVGDALATYDMAGAVSALVGIASRALGTDGVVRVMSSIIAGIAAQLPTLIPAVVNLITYLTTVLVQQAPLLLDAGIQLLMALVQGIIAALPGLIAALPIIIDAIVTALMDAIPMLIDAGIQLLMALVDAIPVVIDALVDALPQIIVAIQGGLISAMPQIIDAAIRLMMAMLEAWPVIVKAIITAGPQLIAAIIRGFAQGAPQVFEGAKTLLHNIVDAVPDIVRKMRDAAGDIISGIVNGLKDNTKKLWNAAQDLGRSILNGVKSFLGIHSPSTVMASQGRWIVAGLINGMDDMPDQVDAVLGRVDDKIQDWQRKPPRIGSIGLPSIPTPRAASLIGAISGGVYGAAQASGRHIVGAPAGGGTTIYNDNRMTQTNDYHVPVATPAQVAEDQRAAFRRLAQGVQ